MNKTKNILFLLFAIVVLPLQAHVDIPMSPTNDDPEVGGSRSVVALPVATLDGTELTLSYPLSTESQVIIIDQSTQVTVYTETFAASRSLNIDLEEEGLPDGSYTLRIYAFGKWWVGEFVLE